ncbi:MAG TPA: glycine zipper domain-containing protein [Chitinophagaceae bacterium]|nr:glycine zipper domain-containing protein [Chitinophagaceae bacterium]
MKTVIPIFSLAIIMVACKSNPGINNQPGAISTTQQITTDTAGLAQFQQWKAANELAAIKEYKASVVDYPVSAPVRKASKVYTAPQPKQSTRTNHASSNSDAGTMSSESSNAAKAPVKKGISKAAKGTAIGAGAGAVAGAVIGKKNRVVGGVIGGVVGGAVGYGIGRHMDKQDGRY